MLKLSKIISICLVFLTTITLNNIAFANLIPISAKQYLAENPSQERKAIIDYITNQFDIYRETNITQQKLDDLWSNVYARDKLFMIRFQIVNQKLYADSCYLMHDHFVMLLNYLNKLIKQYKINDLDFIVYSGDDTFARDLLTEEQKQTLTILHSKDTSDLFEKDRILFPDSYMITSRWEELTKKIIDANSDFNWDTKIPKVFWRGKTTGLGGIKYNLDNFSKLPRLKLVVLSNLYPSKIDAKFTDYYNFSKDKNGDNLVEILDILHSKGSHETEVDHLNYKYLISIDGNTCAWIRVPWIMLSNSVLLKQETSKIEWFYSAIKPFIHYIPIEENLTDIFEKLEWSKNNDEEAKKISFNAQNFILNELMPNNIDSHSVIILNEYSKLHKDKIFATLTPADILIKKIEEQQSLEKERNMTFKDKRRRFIKMLKQKIKNFWNSL